MSALESHSDASLLLEDLKDLSVIELWNIIDHLPISDVRREQTFKPLRKMPEEKQRTYLPPMIHRIWMDLQGSGTVIPKRPPSEEDIAVSEKRAHEYATRNFDQFASERVIAVNAQKEGISVEEYRSKLMTILVRKLMTKFAS